MPKRPAHNHTCSLLATSRRYFGTQPSTTPSNLLPPSLARTEHRRFHGQPSPTASQTLQVNGAHETRTHRRCRLLAFLLACVLAKNTRHHHVQVFLDSTSTILLRPQFLPMTRCVLVQRLSRGDRSIVTRNSETSRNLPCNKARQAVRHLFTSPRDTTTSKFPPIHTQHHLSVFPGLSRPHRMLI